MFAVPPRLGGASRTAAPDLSEGPRAAERPCVIAAADGYPLGATLYHRAHGPPPSDVAVLCAGGGIAARRYRHFVRYLARAGLPTLAYDYRGIGASSPPRRRGLDAGIEHWAEFDHVAAVRHLRGLYPDARVAVIAHSIGCVVATTSTDAAQVGQFVLIAPHLGYWRDYRPPWRWLLTAFWHGIAPAAALAFGYFPASRLGVGDDCPRRFVLQWARQTASGRLPPTLMPVEARLRLQENARRVEAPCLLLTFDGDAFVGDFACVRFAQLLSRARTIRRHVASDGDAAIGHWGFFSRRNSHLWPLVVDFLLSARRSPPRESSLQQEPPC